jgi:hypothetical protein
MVTDSSSILPVRGERRNLHTAGSFVGALARRFRGTFRCVCARVRVCERVSRGRPALVRSQVYPPRPWDTNPLEVHFNGSVFMLTTPQGYASTVGWYPLVPYLSTLHSSTIDLT